MRTGPTCFTILIVAIFSTATAQNEFPRVGKYRIDARFFPESSRLEARATVYPAPGQPFPREPVCYLHGELQVDSAVIGMRRINVRQDHVLYDYDYSLVATEARLAVEGQNCDSGITIFYSGYFHASQARSPSDYMRIDNDGVFLRSYGYSLWFPVFLPANHDDYSTSFAEVTIRTPLDFRPVFVGTKKGEYVQDSTRVTEWTATNMTLRAAQCTAQRFVVDSQGNCFLYFHADSQSRAAARAIMAFAQQTTALYGKYYRHATSGAPMYLMEMPEYGDISSGNVTGLTYWTWQKFADDENAKRALGHELVHPYVAVPVERTDSLYAVAVEGFPSYFHLPVLAEALGDEFYNRFIGWMETLYLEKRQTGKTRWGAAVPPEKPLLAITADELPTYKDEFVLDDRALLFLNYLYRRMGRERFFAFTSELLNRERLTAASFREMIRKHLPGSAKDVEVWLTTTDYPERFHLKK